MDLENTSNSTTTDVAEANTNHLMFKAETPLERCKTLGVGALTDAELLAVSFFTGNNGLTIAQTLLQTFGHVSNLYSFEPAEFESIPGIDSVMSLRLTALLELTRRLTPSPFESKLRMKTPADVARYYCSKLRGEVQEKLYVLLLDSAGRLIREVLVSIGTLNTTAAHPREVFRCAIAHSAASAILLHNHPSGNPSPSVEDWELTMQLRTAGMVLGIRVEDHIIVAGESYTSMKESDLW